MNILYICNEYPPTIHGGIGSFTRDIAEAMLGFGHKVTIWGVYPGLEKDIEEDIRGVKIFRNKGSKDGGRWNSVRFRWEFNQKLKQFLRSRNFDIIECQEWTGLFPLGLDHPGFIVRLHGSALFFDQLLGRKGGILTHWFEKRMIRSSKNLVAVSDFCGRETMRLCGISGSPYEVIYNAVDTQRLEKFFSSDYVPYKIIFANSVIPKKGVFELLKAFILIAEEYPQSELYIIGKLTYQQEWRNVKDLLMDMVPESLKDRIHLTGWLSSEGEILFKHFADAHVCVYPSHMESFGIAPVEPMALSKPVIFMKTGPGPEVIEHGVSGLLADSFDPEDIAQQIRLVFNDEALAKRLGEEARKRVLKMFDKNTVFAERNNAYYQRILQQK